MRQLRRTARTLEAEWSYVLWGSLSAGAKEDKSSTGHVWTAGFHHVKARSRLARVLKLVLFTSNNTSASRTFFSNNIIIFSGSAAQRGLWPPRPRCSLITHNDAPQSVGLLLDDWSARRRDFYMTTHNTHNRKNIHVPDGIRSHDRSRPASVDPHLRPRGHWDREQ
jgi:hypothetical protein